MKLFERLANRVVKEEATYVINNAGRQLLEKYYILISEIERAIEVAVQKYVVDEQSISKEAAIQVVSTINSQQVGTKEFEIMSRLDTLTNGGDQPIDSAKFSFNQQDPILNYLDKS